MQDYTRPHIARLVQHYVLEVEINGIILPTRSQNLNAIENLLVVRNQCSFGKTLFGDRLNFCKN